MQSTFEFCFKTTVADFYDISVLVNGSLIASSPCYACAHIIPLGVNSAEVQDLPSVVVAGSDVHFGVVLYDIYKNVISPSAAVSVEFYPNPHKYIIADDPNPDTNRYNFVLNVNHTETFTISLYINGHLFEGHNYTIEVIASTPSSNSILSFVSNELQLVKNQEFVLDVKLQSSRGVSVPANQYAIAIRLTNSLTLHPFYNFGYSCYLLSQEENGYAEIHQTMTDEMQLTTEEADAAINAIRGMTTEEACSYLETEYRYFGAEYSLENSRYKQGDVSEVNTYIQEKMQEHTYSYYFARKYADFAGLFMAFFATILLAFLFLRDTRKDTYELLHTKPISAWQYILGKVGSGYIILMMVLAVLTIVFGGLCIANGVTQGFSVNPLDFLIADVLYIMPNMLMIVCVYAIAALIFKNPLPATPLLFLYIIYSNMGGTAANGQYGYQGRLLSIIVRFPGRFFDTEMPPMLLLNQTFLILASVSIICITIYVWNRRRVY